MATINTVLEKAAKSSVKTQVARLDIRGPGGCIIVVDILTDNIKPLKMLLQSLIKKNK